MGTPLDAQFEDGRSLGGTYQSATGVVPVVNLLSINFRIAGLIRKYIFRVHLHIILLATME